MPESGSKVVRQTTTKVVQSAVRKDMTPEQAQARAAELDAEKARIAEVLSMGLVTEMIRVKDPDPARRYCWVRETEGDIQKYQLLGYEVETAAGKGEHQTGDNRRRVGDVILMSCDRDRYNLIEEVRSEQKKKRLTSPVKEYKERAEAAARVGEAAPPVDFLEE